jgi:hypothetical protein
MLCRHIVAEQAEIHVRICSAHLPLVLGQACRPQRQRKGEPQIWKQVRIYRQ